MFDLLLKARRAGEELDFATIASIERIRARPQQSARSTHRRRPLQTSSPQPRNPPKTPIRRSKPNRVAKMRRTKPILVFIKSFKRSIIAIKTSESIRRGVARKSGRAGITANEPSSSSATATHDAATLETSGMSPIFGSAKMPGTPI